MVKINIFLLSLVIFVAIMLKNTLDVEWDSWKKQHGKR